MKTINYLLVSLRCDTKKICHVLTAALKRAPLNPNYFHKLLLQFVFLSLMEFWGAIFVALLD